jgi:hypothetical protein
MIARTGFEIRVPADRPGATQPTKHAQNSCILPAQKAREKYIKVMM